MNAAEAAALAALLLGLGLLVCVTVDGVRHAVVVERTYARSVHDRPRQSRRCPWCGGWFNSTELQDAHEADCDLQPSDEDLSSWGVPTPADVLAMAFPPHPGVLPEVYAGNDVGRDPRLLAPFRRGRLGRWVE